MKTLAVLCLIGLAIYGAWMTSQARHHLGTTHRRRKDDK